MIKENQLNLLSERLDKLEAVTNGTHAQTIPWHMKEIDTTKTLRYLAQHIITDGRHFDKWNQMASDNNWEGCYVT